MGTAIGVIVVIAVYLAPTAVAFGRHHNVGAVAAVNVLVGWTVIGWIVALVMALGSNRPAGGNVDSGVAYPDDPASPYQEPPPPADQYLR